MKKIIILIFVLIGISNISSNAQFSIGLKAGLSSFDMAKNGILIKDEVSDAYKISFKDAKYGFHIGLFADIKIKTFSIEPALIFNTMKVNYEINEISTTTIIESYKTYKNLDIPVMFGINLGRFRFQAGPVAHILLSSSKDLLQSDNYEEMFKKATYGYQAGMAFKLLWNMSIEVNYEGNLTKFGESYIINGIEYQYSDRPHRVIASVIMRFM